MAPEVAGYRPITVQQGSAFNPTWTWYDKKPDEGGVPINLTGYTARAQIKMAHTDVAPLVSMTTENGGITLGGAAGTVTPFISATVTAALDAPATGVWDFKMIPPAGETHAFRWVQGPVFFTPETTQ